VPDVEHAGSGRKLRRHVDNRLAVSDQALRELDTDTDTAGALDRPGPVRPALRQPQQVAVTGAVVHHLQRGELLLAFVQHRHRVRPLGRVNADHHCCHCCLRLRGDGRPGSPTSSEADPS
jgi:hypothetical protein